MPGGYANKLYPLIPEIIPLIPPVILLSMVYLSSINDEMLFLDGAAMEYLGS